MNCAAIESREVGVGRGVRARNRPAADHRRDADATFGAGATLVIGYGNILRSDDGVGPVVVQRLAAILKNGASCECLVVHQLMPELAEAVSRASQVFFVDASISLPAGKSQVRRAKSRHSESPGVGHFLDPETLLAICEALFGRAPTAWVVGVGVASLAVGSRLSPAVRKKAEMVARNLAARLNRAKMAPRECRNVCLPASQGRSRKG